MPEANIARAAAGDVRRFVTFGLAGTVYALPAEEIAEIIHVPAVARIPHSPRALVGIANLRGNVLPVVSLRGLLGRNDTVATASTAKALVLDAGAAVALAVDVVYSLVSVAANQIEVREAELGAAEGEQLSGAFKTGRDGEVAKILDLHVLLKGAFARRPQITRQPGVTKGTAKQLQDQHSSTGAVEMLVTFEVAGQEFALDLASVQEILPAPAVVVAVPRAETVVLGVTSLRDRLLPLLSLRGLLGLPAATQSDGREKVVVMTVGGAQVGLVADRAKAIVAAPATSIDPVPPVLASRTGGESSIKSIYRGEAGRRLISILMPDKLFREDVMQRLGQSREESGAGAGEAKPSKSGELKFLVFRLGADEFALPIESVDEVGQVSAKITRVPKTPEFLEGVVNLRGDVLAVVDQRRRFDLPPREQNDTRRLVVVRTAENRAGLIVDSVSDVLRVPAGSVEPAPELTSGIARLVKGVINLETVHRMVLVLDPSELLTPAERGALDAFEKSGRASA